MLVAACLAQGAVTSAPWDLGGRDQREQRFRGYDHGE